MKYIDLTHTFNQNMPVYPGDTPPEFSQTDFFDQQGYNCFQIKTGMHVGTHMDAPLHMLKDGNGFRSIRRNIFSAMSSYFCSRAKIDRRAAFRRKAN